MLLTKIIGIYSLKLNVFSYGVTPAGQSVSEWYASRTWPLWNSMSWFV